MPAPTPTAQPEVALPGIGATRSHWNKTHDELPGGEPGTGYGPLVRGNQEKYAGVDGEDRILFYLLFFETGTSLKEARQQVLADEVPPDSKFAAEDASDPECLRTLVTSRTLASVLGPKAVVHVTFFSDPEGDPDGGFNFRSNDVQYANVSLYQDGRPLEDASC